MSRALRVKMPLSGRKGFSPRSAGWSCQMLNRLTDSLNFQTQALVLRSERQRLIASNIANADTPGYQARDLDFSTALRQATGEMAPQTLATSQAGHLQASGGARATAQLLYASPSQTNLDRNTVDMDRERASFADNSIKYEATLRFINSSVRTMLDAIKSPSQG
jgi:flagellar basal-body rod protein FlgB